jgi:hypothetical protein
MNQTFEFRRWLMLVSSHWAEHRKRYLLTLLAIGGLITAWYSFLLMVDKFGPIDPFVQFSTFYCGIFFVGCFYASTIFSELGDKSRAIQYLSVPASHLEKLLCGILFGVVLFFLAYVVIFYLVDIPMVSLANRIVAREHQHWPGSFDPIPPSELLDLWNSKWAPAPDRKYHLFFFGYFAIQSAFLLGSVYFKRFSFIRTAVAVLVFWGVFVLFATKVVRNIVPDGWNTYDLIKWIDTKDNNTNFRFVTLPTAFENILIFCVQYSIPPIFWIITYVRLKEKEV